MANRKYALHAYKIVDGGWRFVHIGYKCPGCGNEVNDLVEIGKISLCKNCVESMRKQIRKEINSEQAANTKATRTNKGRESKGNTSVNGGS